MNRRFVSNFGAALILPSISALTLLSIKVTSWFHTVWSDSNANIISIRASSLEHKTLGVLHGISYMLQQLHAENRVAKRLRAAGVRLLGLGTRLIHSSVIQGSTAHSSNNPGMLYRTTHWHLAQDWSTLSNSYCITTHLGSSTVMPCMHTSQRVKEYHKNTHGNWQLSLRVEKKPLSSHDRQKLASGLSGGIDATVHALRVDWAKTNYRNPRACAEG